MEGVLGGKIRVCGGEIVPLLRLLLAQEEAQRTLKHDSEVASLDGRRTAQMGERIVLSAQMTSSRIVREGLCIPVYRLQARRTEVSESLVFLVVLGQGRMGILSPPFLPLQPLVALCRRIERRKGERRGPKGS